MKVKSDGEAQCSEHEAGLSCKEGRGWDTCLEKFLSAKGAPRRGGGTARGRAGAPPCGAAGLCSPEDQQLPRSVPARGGGLPGGPRACAGQVGLPRLSLQESPSQILPAAAPPRPRPRGDPEGEKAFERSLSLAPTNILGTSVDEASFS